MLSVKNIVKSYPDQSGGRNVILNGIDLEVGEREFLCILGPSGCGKTTLLRCIAGFEDDYEGEVLINGEAVRKPGTDRIMVFQDFNQLFPWKTVEKNIQYPLKLKGIKDKNTLKEISDRYLKMVDLDGKQKYYPHQLSGGMKQRVAIAKALALQPKLILMDEPFAALDAMTRNNLQKELLGIFERENVAVIFITHNIQEALVLGTRTMVMGKNGQIKIDEANPIQKPVTPASEHYGELWERYNKALQDENRKIREGV